MQLKVKMTVKLIYYKNNFILKEIPIKIKIIQILFKYKFSQNKKIKLIKTHKDIILKNKMNFLLKKNPLSAKSIKEYLTTFFLIQ
jgi:hypothetical protein